jgi:hypothetical protein
MSLYLGGGALVAKLGPIWMEARHGRIVLHDHRDGSTTYLFPSQFRHRVNAMKDIFDEAVNPENKVENSLLLDGLPRETWERFFDDCHNLELLLKAQVPIEDVATRRERRKKTMHVGIDVSKLMNELPPMDLSSYTGAA